MNIIPSLAKDIMNKSNHAEPPIKYNLGEAITFRSPLGVFVGNVVKEFSKSEFGWLLRVTYNSGADLRDIYFNEIIQPA